MGYIPLDREVVSRDRAKRDPDLVRGETSGSGLAGGGCRVRLAMELLGNEGGDRG